MGSIQRMCVRILGIDSAKICLQVALLKNRKKL